MKTSHEIKRRMYPNLTANTWGKNEKSISEWIKLKGLNLLEIRRKHIFHLDSYCTEKYFDILIKSHLH